jgi:hypothetical protein
MSQQTIDQAMAVQLIDNTSWVEMSEQDGVYTYTFTGLISGDYAYNFFNGWGGLVYEVISIIT